MSEDIPQADNVIMDDISHGKELRAVPVINNINDKAPQEFTYILTNVKSYETRNFLREVSSKPGSSSDSNYIRNHQGCNCQFNRDELFSCGVNCDCEKNSYIEYDPNNKIVIHPQDYDFYKHFYVECGPHCRCMGKCNRKMIHNGKTTKKVSMKYSKAKGFGVFAEQPIAVGMPVSEFIGEIFIRQLESETYRSDYQHDLLIDNREVHFVIEARRVANVARFFNHSCFPTLIPICVYPSIPDPARFPPLPRCIFVASRAILPGKELTFDYRPSYFYDRQLTCKCYEFNCQVPPADWNEKAKGLELTKSEINREKQQIYSLLEATKDLEIEEIVLD